MISAITKKVIPVSLHPEKFPAFNKLLVFSRLQNSSASSAKKKITQKRIRHYGIFHSNLHACSAFFTCTKEIEENKLKVTYSLQLSKSFKCLSKKKKEIPCKCFHCPPKFFVYHLPQAVLVSRSKFKEAIEQLPLFFRQTARFDIKNFNNIKTHVHPSQAPQLLPHPSRNSLIRPSATS
jgi:hypothetical protein